MESEINKELIFSHFDRKSSPLQRELIAQWLHKKANEEQYYEWLEEWENRHPQYLTQPERSAQLYATFLVENPHSESIYPTESTPGRLIGNGWHLRQWLVAASILLLLGSSLSLFQHQIVFQTYQTGFGETRSLRLTDGSVVRLNPNSSLRVPRWGFGRKTREVLLTGEATFSVTHLPDAQTFVVKTTNDLTVVVLGTEFSVFARKRGARVKLNKGKVQLHYQEGKATKQLIMEPGDLVTIDPQNRLARRNGKQSQPQLIAQEKRFVFDETTLQEVAYLLEENYGLQVDIKNEALSQRVIMGSFRADNVDQLLQSISELLDINVVRQGNHVQISGQ